MFNGDFNKNVEADVAKALDLIKQKFENQEEAKDNLPFHNVEHSKGVKENVEEILRAIQQASPELVSDHDVDIGRLAAAYHDIVQLWTEKKVKEGEFEKVIRDRSPGKRLKDGVEININNEADSGDKAAECMRIANRNGEVYSGADIEAVRKAISMTVAGWDPKRRTVAQTNLKDSSSAVELALALADLATAGKGGPEKFADEGKRLFREDNLDILEAIGSGENISHDKQEYFKTRMLNFLRSQPAFALGREVRLYDEIRSLPPLAQEAIKRLFNKFGDSILGAEKIVAKAEGMSFGELVEYFGY